MRDVCECKHIELKPKSLLHLEFGGVLSVNKFLNSPSKKRIQWKIIPRTSVEIHIFQSDSNVELALFNEFILYFVVVISFSIIQLVSVSLSLCLFNVFFSLSQKQKAPGIF